MRRRRRHPQNADSLELLLDTLCNTFGGVLFIAMLVVVLLQLVGNESATPIREPVQAEDLRDLADELEIISREFEAIPDRVPSANQAEGDAGAGAKERLAEALSRLDELRSKKDTKLIQAGRHDAEVLAIDEELSAMDKRQEQANREAEDLRKQIEHEKKSNAHVIRTPVMHPSNKQPIAVELRYDRLYLVHQHNSMGQPEGPNLDEYVLLSESSSGILVTADPTRGTPVVAGQGFAQAMKQRLARFSPDRWILDLVVRGDSFGSFYAFKEAARELGYEMRLLIVREDAVFADQGGKDRDVQ